jgi:hypothetical protein
MATSASAKYDVHPGDLVKAVAHKDRWPAVNVCVAAQRLSGISYDVALCKAESQLVNIASVTIASA